MRRDQGGYIVIETVGCFVLFILLLGSIINLINIVTLQAKMHFALTQTAETLSIYTYALDKLNHSGAAEDDFAENLDDLINGLEGFSQSQGREIAGGKYGMQEAVDGKDSVDILLDYIHCGDGGSINYLYWDAIHDLMNRYLSNGSLTGDEYLNQVGVVSNTGERGKGVDALSFYAFPWTYLSTDGMPLNDDGDIVIQVTYFVDYTFGALPLPFTRLRMTQQVYARAWGTNHIS